MEHAIATMPVEQRHAYLEFCHDRRRRCFTPARRVRVKYSLATFAASNRRCEI
jgi:hypothetical protein